MQFHASELSIQDSSIGTVHKYLRNVLPFASGTFLSAIATALITISFTETLTSCFSVIEKRQKDE